MWSSKKDILTGQGHLEVKGHVTEIVSIKAPQKLSSENEYKLPRKKYVLAIYH